MPTLYDYTGRPIETSELTKEIAAPSLSGVRTHWHDSIASGLTPEDLGNILRAVDDENDIQEYLTLAEEMEMRDLHYASVLSTRKNAVSGLDVMIEAVTDDAQDVKIRDFVAEVVDDDPFKDMLREETDALGKGFSVCEIMWDRSEAQWAPKEYKHRDPRFFQFDYNTGQELRLRHEDDMVNGLPLQSYKFIQHRPKIKTGLPIRGGLARLAVVAYMCKGYGLKDWMAFAEVFGMPLRVGKHDTAATKDQKAALLRAVASIGTDAACIIPDSMIIDFIETSKTAGGEKLFERLVDWLDKQVSKGVLGQVATTEGTPGRLGSDDAQHAVRQDIKVADATQLSATLRRDFLKPLVDLNFGPRKRTEYPKLRLMLEEPEDLKGLADSLPEFIDRGLKVQSSVILDKFGIPEAEEDAEILQPKDLAATPPTATESKPSPEPEPEPEPQPAGEETEEALEREQHELAIELMRKVRRGEELTGDQRVVLASIVAAQRQPTTVQSLILSKERFKSREAARNWVTGHKYHATKIDETETSYRFRQREPGEFKPGSFRTITLTDGVKAVIGKLKVQTAREEPEGDEIDRLTDEELKDWKRQMDPVLKPILDHAANVDNYQEFLDGLEKAAATMDSTLLAERLAVSTFKTRGLGDATDEV